MSSAQDHKALVSRIADNVWNKGELHVVDEIMVGSARYHGPHMPLGVGSRDDWRQAIGFYLGAFPDSHVTFDELIVTGDTVVGRWSATGTQTGPLSGLPPTGRPIAIGGITIYRIVDGLIVEAWEQLDLLGMWQQLGVIELPGHGRS